LDFLGNPWSHLDFLGICCTEAWISLEIFGFSWLEKLYFSSFYQETKAKGRLRCSLHRRPGVDTGLDPGIAWSPSPIRDAAQGSDMAGAGAAGGWQSRQYKISLSPSGGVRTVALGPRRDQGIEISFKRSLLLLSLGT
jgi:hypothetical protein